MDLKIEHEEWLHMSWQGDDHERSGRVNLSIRAWMRALDCLEEYEGKMQKVDFSEEVWNDMDEDITERALRCICVETRMDEAWGSFMNCVARGAAFCRPNFPPPSPAPYIQLEMTHLIHVKQTD